MYVERKFRNKKGKQNFNNKDEKNIVIFKNVKKFN